MVSVKQQQNFRQLKYEPVSVLADKLSKYDHGHVLDSVPNALHGQGTDRCDEPNSTTCNEYGFFQQ